MGHTIFEGGRFGRTVVGARWYKLAHLGVRLKGIHSIRVFIDEWSAFLNT
jgi:hypothetical protein